MSLVITDRSDGFLERCGDEFNDRYDTEHGFETITRSHFIRFVPA